MDENVRDFVVWLQSREDELPPFSNELIDATARAVEEGGYPRAKETVFDSKVDAREKMGMEVILDRLESAGVDNAKGSFLVRRIDAISRSARGDKASLSWRF